MTAPANSGRLSFLAAAWVIARRDFTAILFSRSFFLFLLGPLFPLLIASLAGGVGARMQTTIDHPQIGLAMSPADARAIMAARGALLPSLSGALPEFVVLDARDARLEPDRLLRRQRGDVAAVLSGGLASPKLTGPAEEIAEWRGPIALVANKALTGTPRDLPRVALQPTRQTASSDRSGRLLTAQSAQTLMFLLTMLLAGMVLSNLVEEKANKIIEVLAAAIPMDALFLGKLFAMLALSFVGIATWGGVCGLYFLMAGSSDFLAAPAVGWPMMAVLGVLYFSMAYLLLGSVFLTIGSLATTVREVQTLSMPVTMTQLLVFFLASYAMTQPGSAIELAAVFFPFSSPFAMLARAAREPALAPHLLLLAWQALWVFLLVRFGSALFRKRVMKSGPAGARGRRRPRWGRRIDRAAPSA